ncbi:17559_t:CDS:2, partial [Racocetra persica]
MRTEPRYTFSINLPISLYQRVVNEAGKGKISTFIKEILEEKLAEKTRKENIRELQGRHPGLVISNDEQNKFSPLITIIPLTSQVDKIYPFQVYSELKGRSGVILVDQIRTIDRKRFAERTLPNEILAFWMLGPKSVRAKLANLPELELSANRTNVKKINIDGKNLKGTLAVGDVDGFVNLEEFRCLNNHLLTEIDISKCTKLKKVICINNTKLVNLHLPNSISFLECQANPLTFLSLRICSKLKEINCSGNLLKSIKLPYLCHELEKLDIRMIEKEKIQQGIYNRFYGSLEPLKNLKKLRFLRICNTDIDSGLEHLPNNIETFDCSSYLRRSEFEERLKLAKAKSILAQELQEREELTQQLEQTKNVCFQQEQTINYLQQTLTDLQEEKTQVETELLGKINELKYELNL